MLLKDLPQLKNIRHSHAMTWIDGNPAVIGGINSDIMLNSVEVLKNNQ
jgi:hypothetical protein